MPGLKSPKPRLFPLSLWEHVGHPGPMRCSQRLRVETRRLESVLKTSSGLAGTWSMVIGHVRLKASPLRADVPGVRFSAAEVVDERGCPTHFTRSQLRRKGTTCDGKDRSRTRPAVRSACTANRSHRTGPARHGVSCLDARQVAAN